MTILIRTTSQNKDFLNLIQLLDKTLQIVDGDNHPFFAQFNTVENIKNVVVCYENDIAVGCGAFKEYSPNTIEIKRMFVHADYRKKGNAKQILQELEQWAIELNYELSILETGIKLQNAINLYKNAGYTQTAKYEPYINVETSVCMKKILK